MNADTRNLLRALFTIDTAQNQATLHCVGDDALIAVQQPRYELLVAGMNSGDCDPGLAALGLPTLGNNQQLVILKEEEIDADSFAEVTNTSAQQADKILALSRPAIEA